MSEEEPTQQSPVQKRLIFFSSLPNRSIEESHADTITISFLGLNPNVKTQPSQTFEVSFGTIPVGIGKELIPKNVVCALVDFHPWDLNRPLVQNCSLGFVNFEDARGEEVFWHSSAHVLGAAIEEILNTEIAIGPAENGFFYDFLPTEKKVDQEVLESIEKKCIELCKVADFERKVITREEALKLFENNRFKVEILNTRVKPEELVSVYRTGAFVDLCRGPHLTTAKSILSWWVKDVSGSCWGGDSSKALQRIRAITFPDKSLLKKHKDFLEEAARRDHKTLGPSLELFFTHPWSPGCAFFFPAGARVYNKMIELIRGMYISRGFIEVCTPNLFHQDLFETSGHWEHYQDDMFHFEDKGYGGDKKKEFGIKPMNCPGHCLIFKQISRSFRDLPIRMAEFGVLHRNEASGALTGLTRVRRFVQDDAHIFLRKDQVGQEMEMCISFVQDVYSIFGMDVEFTLSTKNPEKYMGDDSLWEDAENHLREILKSKGIDYIENPGDAAFYGPKIDFKVKDCLGRKHQLATIQLDFNLPQRFGLFYADSENKKVQPVMIHRAILGSLERFFAIALEHYAGRFPFWLSPRQIRIIPQNDSRENHVKRVLEIKTELYNLGYAIDAELSDLTMKKKIAEAFALATNVVLVIGDKEIANGTVSARWRSESKEESKVKVIPYEEFKSIIAEKVKNHT